MPGPWEVVGLGSRHLGDVAARPLSSLFLPARPPPTPTLLLGWFWEGGLGRESSQLALCLPYAGVGVGRGVDTSVPYLFSSWTAHLQLHTTGQLCGRLLQATSLCSYSANTLVDGAGDRVLASLKVTEDLSCQRAVAQEPKDRVFCSLGWLFLLPALGFQACTTSVCSAGI